MPDTAGIPGDRICSFIERIEHIDEEIKALNQGKKEVYSEAKGEGFDVKVLKEILRLRKQDKDERDEQESLLDLYLRAMESAGASRAEAAWRQAGSELPIFKEARFHRVSAPHMTNSAAAKPLAELRPAAPARCVANRDGDRFFLADQNHQ